MKKNKVGAPKKKDSTKSCTVSLRPSEKRFLEKKFGTLTMAIKTLLESNGIEVQQGRIS